MSRTNETSRDYARVARAIEFLAENQADLPHLDAVAASVGMSEYHFQRVFRRWAGVSPKRFLQYLTLSRAKEELRSTSALLDATYAVGLSSPSRLHDLFVSVDAVTPGEYRTRGEGLDLTTGFATTPYGECLLTTSSRGICNLQFTEPGDRDRSVDELRRRWPEATWNQDDARAKELARRVFGERPRPDLMLHLRGTNFQLKVWEALLRVPAGHLVSYGQVARALGMPRAVRAVASAVGANPVAVLIPCHRVIRSTGHFGQYRWGPTRKLALIGKEAVTELAVGQ